MAQEIADSKLIDTWGSSGRKIEPDISKIIEGWQLGEQPPHEYMNWLQNTFGSKLNHILKNGIASWNNETEYLAGSSVQHSGSIWICETTNTNSEPTGLNANWEKVAINKDLTVTVDTLSDLRSISYPANTIWVSGYHTKNDGAFGSHIFRLKGIKTTETDNGGTVIIATIGGVDYVYELQFDGAVNVKWFGAKGDWNGTSGTDDTIAIQTALSNTSGVLDGGGNTYLYSSKSGAVTNILCTGIHNMRIKTLEEAILCSIPNNNFSIVNFHVSGNRGNFIELWEYYATTNGEDSIQPYIGAFISGSNNNSVTVNNCTFKNMFNKAVIVVAGTAKVTYKDIIFENIANKAFWSYPSSTSGLEDSGITYASNIYVESVGILPDIFNYKNDSGVTTTVAYGDANMPMPQGSYGCIVSRGKFYAENITVKDYGSTAITFDLNLEASGKNLTVSNNNVKSISNNPSSAVWCEFCDKVTLDTIKVNINYKGDDTGTYGMFVSTKEDAVIDIRNIDIMIDDSVNGVSLALASLGGSIYNISNIKLVTNLSSSAGVMHFYGPSSSSVDSINISNAEIISYKGIRCQQSKFKLSNSNVETVDSNGFFVFDGIVTGMQNFCDYIKINDSSINGPIPFLVKTNLLSITNSTIQAFAAYYAYKIDILNCFTKGINILGVAKFINIIESSTGRVYITGASNNIIHISNNNIFASIANYALSVESSPLICLISNNLIAVDANVAGSSYIRPNTNQIETGNKNVSLSSFPDYILYT